jgi:formate hydrogenlyase transcriptional activator
LDDDGESLHVFEFDREPDAPPIKTGTRISRIGAVARVLDEQQPVFMPDVAQEMLKHPALAPFAPESVGRPTYAFPISTSQKQYGILVVTKDRGQEFMPEDVEMLRSLASHVAVALECALARDRAELYQREVMKERDRLQLLLEVNNHIVSKLEVDEFFQAVAASMRKHFGNDATTFWLINKQSGCLERRFLDFPTGRGFLEKVSVAVPTDFESEWWRLRTPQTYSAELEGVPATIRDAARAESLVSAVSVPLVGSEGPLGLFNMSSRTSHAFGQQDFDLLSQIGTQISLALDNALAYGRLRASNDDLQDQRLYLESEIRSEFNFEDIVGKGAAIQNVLKQVAIVAPTDSTVLLHGETGTGKELVARAIHRSSPRRERTFVKLNCAAIPSGLLESELFGHERGAFTGALMQKKGRFEIADHGTLFLDEIGDISMELQPKLLRAVQEQEFERLGSTRTIHVNVRMIAATHRDIAAMIRNNQFREDLFYRLNVFPIEIPPLRERPGDIPLLVHYFVSRLARRMQKKIETIPKRAMEALVNASWPGNVRELENFIERAVILTQGSELNVPTAELKNTMRAPRTGSVSTFHDAERQAIIDALKAASGRIAGAGGAAERLGLKRTTLQNKMRQLQISRSEYLISRTG